MVKLLKSQSVPEDRQGTIVELIGKRGTAEDLAFIYHQAIAREGFAESVRVKALDALAGAAANRSLKPAGDLEKLVPLVQDAASRSGAAVGRPAIRLAGLWKLEPAASALADLARSEAADESLRPCVRRSGDYWWESRISSHRGAGRRKRLTADAAAGDRRPDQAGSSGGGGACCRDSGQAGQAGAEPGSAGAGVSRPAGRIGAAGQGPPGRAVPADSAKLVLRAVYTLGRSDQALVEALSHAAGIAEPSKPLSPNELSNMVSEVAAKGDPARGEGIFRRGDLNCMSCHAVSKAGGDVGPDLSAVGQISPPDYIINSILNPDQAIKEQYNTLMIQTVEGQMFQGIVTDKDEQRIVLKDATGATRVVPVASIEDQKPGGSLMPKGLANLMTRAEFLDLVRFLSELGKPGPYAIRPVPAIQRWKVLKAVSQDLAKSVPGGSILRGQVLRAAPEKWDVAYAKVDGSLPLDDAISKSGGEVVYLQGAIDVSAAGAVRVQADSAPGVHLWIDELPVPSGSPSLTIPLAAGRHDITLRVDTAARPSHSIRVEVAKPPGSTVEFTVVGGR